MNSRRLTFPLVVVGILAIVLAVWFAVLTIHGGDDAKAPPSQHAAETPSAKPTAAPLESHRLVVRSAGYAVGVPAGLKTKRQGKVTYLTNRPHGVVIVIAPTESGSLKATNATIITTMRQGTYRSVKVAQNQTERVDKRRGLATFGTAVNKGGSRIRFVHLTVKAHPRNITISTYTTRGSDPAWVLPRVNQVANTLRVLGKH